MALNNEVRRLENIIERLEEARSNVLLISDSFQEEFQITNLDTDDMIEDIEGTEAALLVIVSWIDEVAQVLNEEIANLRDFSETLEENAE
ncbi:MAG: hypothetical protein HQ551_12675 [Desulfobacteraceae bacterium]|nr:hypothetical protein [Desulfobacteraceae bacterium]